MYLSPSSDLLEGVYVYQYPTSDEAILSEINPSLVHIKELCISQINIQSDDNKQLPARRTFFSRKQHYDLMTEYLSELWGIRPKGEIFSNTKVMGKVIKCISNTVPLPIKLGVSSREPNLM